MRVLTGLAVVLGCGVGVYVWRCVRLVWRVCMKRASKGEESESVRNTWTMCQQCPSFCLSCLFCERVRSCGGGGGSGGVRCLRTAQ